MMRAHIGIKSGTFAEDVDPGNHSEFLEGVERAINRVERYRGDALSDSLVNGLRGGMFFSLGNFPKYLHTLMREFESGCPTSLVEISHAAFNFGDSYSHRRSVL